MYGLDLRLDLEKIAAVDDSVNSYGMKIDTALAETGAKASQAVANKSLAALKKITGETSGGTVHEQLPHCEEEAHPNGDTLKKASALRDSYIAARNIAPVYRDFAAAEDGILRGALHPDGTVSGRYTSGGEGVPNLHSLPRTFSKNEEQLKQARELLRRGNLGGMLKSFPGKTPAQLLAGLARTVIVPREGCRLIMADFSQIELRVLAWLSGDPILNSFEAGADVYAETAERTGISRDSAKIALLAVQYGAGPETLQDLGLSEEDASALLNDYKQSRRYAYSEALFRAVQESKADGRMKKAGPVFLQTKGGRIHLKLPSGRTILCGGELYPGKLASIIVQGVAADVLKGALINIDLLKAFDDRILFHVHDELILECPEQSAKKDLAAVLEIMTTAPEWAGGLPLSADGAISDFYRSF